MFHLPTNSLWNIVNNRQMQMAVLRNFDVILDKFKVDKIRYVSNKFFQKVR
jgi:hypothetical protein